MYTSGQHQRSESLLPHHFGICTWFSTIRYVPKNSWIPSHLLYNFLFHWVWLNHRVFCIHCQNFHNSILKTLFSVRFQSYLIQTLGSAKKFCTVGFYRRRQWSMNYDLIKVGIFSVTKFAESFAEEWTFLCSFSLFQTLVPTLHHSGFDFAFSENRFIVCGFFTEYAWLIRRFWFVLEVCGFPHHEFTFWSSVGYQSFLV